MLERLRSETERLRPPLVADLAARARGEHMPRRLRRCLVAAMANWSWMRWSTRTRQYALVPSARWPRASYRLRTRRRSAPDATAKDGNLIRTGVDGARVAVETGRGLREALAAPLVHVGAALISASKHAAWPARLSSASLDFFEHGEDDEVRFECHIAATLTRSKPIFRWTMHILTQVTTCVRAIGRRRDRISTLSPRACARASRRWRLAVDGISEWSQAPLGRVVGELGPHGGARFVRRRGGMRA